jgi:PBP1b-binding outer membrane lipoprotein LpoB
MKKHVNLLILCVVFITGCSINHPVARDYGQYLENNRGDSNFPSTNIEAEYKIDEKTASHRYEFRAATVGYANLWIVEFGDILDETLRSDDVQRAFKKLEKSTSDNMQSENAILFSLANYEFKNYQAYISLNISLLHGNTEVLNKTYTAEGSSQGAKMFIGGVFAMKNATHQSTKIALDIIINNFMKDVSTTTLLTNN